MRLIAIDNITDEDYIKLQKELFGMGFSWRGEQTVKEFPTYTDNGNTKRVRSNALSIDCQFLATSGHWLGMQKDFPGVIIINYKDILQAEKAE